MRTVCAVFAALALVAPLSAQWLKHPTPGIPRNADGTPNLSAPAPKDADGKPDLSGLWRPTSPMIANIAFGLKPNPVPFQPWAETLYKQRQATFGKDDPTANKCIVGGVPRVSLVPMPSKIVQGRGLTVILYEMIHAYRQIFTDGRSLPVDPNPAYLGYSVGRWDGEVFVVETAGFNDNVWLDSGGTPATDALRVTERYRRRDFGRMEVEITIDDPKAYTRPWTVTLPLALLPDTELLEYMCSENNKYPEIVN